MGIRITTQMTSNLMLNTMNKNLSNIYNTYEQISSGKKLTSVGQNPSEGTKLMKYNKQLGQLDDWSKNIETAKDELGQSYDTLGLIQENMQRINELTMQAANSFNSADSIEAIRNEVEQRTRTIAQLANTKYQDKYIFAGSNTSTIPYSLDDDLNVTYSGTAQDGNWERNIEISEGVTMPLNLNGEEIFGNETDGIFATLKELNDALKDPDMDIKAISDMLDPIQAGIKNVTNAQAVISSRVQRLDATSTINDNATLGLTEMRSNLQDTDMAQAATDLIKYQTALQASLQAGATIMQQATLLNYI